MGPFIMVWSWMLENPELTAGFLTSLVLVIGLSFAYQQLRLMKKTNEAKLINNMSIYWDSEIMRQGRKALAEIEIAGTSTLSDELENSRKEKDFEKFVKLARVGNFFEEMGNLTRQKTLDLALIAGRFRTEIIERYKDYEPFIKDNKQEQPTVYEYFKWLAEEIKKVKM